MRDTEAKAAAELKAILALRRKPCDRDRVEDHRQGLAPYEVVDDDEDWQIEPAALGMAYASEDTEEYLGVSAPALGEHQRIEKVVQVADKTSERFAEMWMKDVPEENAEEIVEVEDAPTSPSTAPKCLLPKI